MSAGSSKKTRWEGIARTKVWILPNMAPVKLHRDLAGRIQATRKHICARASAIRFQDGELCNLRAQDKRKA